MVTDDKTPRIHPLTAAAAIALILVCLTGIAAMLGILPNFNKNTAAVVATNTVNASIPAVTATATPLDSASASDVAAAKKPTPAAKVMHKKPVKRPINTAVSTNADNNQYKQSNAASSSCQNCGVVESARAVEQQAPTSGVGAGVGAVVGGLLGNQVGGGSGRTLATIAGAVGGGFAGNAIEKNRHTSISYEIIVRMDNGERQRFIMNEQRWRAGDLIRVENGHLVSR